MAANNETGVLQPWADAAKLCREQGVPFHCDATQWLGKLPPAGLSASDFLTGSGHKFGAVKGTGFLKIAPRMESFHGQVGGGQEHNRRAGTENLPAIRSLVAAYTALSPRISVQAAAWADARKLFESRLRTAIPGVVIVGEKAPRLDNTVLFIPPRHANHRWVAAFDKCGFQLSTGSACATGQEGPSHVLAAMGVDAEGSRHALRVSAGWGTTPDDWTALAAALGEVQAALDAE
jgi:cysteine desulfurase